MKSHLTKNLADLIIAQNQKLKHEVIHLNKNLKLFQTKMMQALDKLIASLSVKSPQYQQLLLFDNPYDCLTAFVDQVTQSTSFSLNTSDENQKLTTQNKRLKNKITQMEQESVAKTMKEEQMIEELNKQISQKKDKLSHLEEDYKSLLKTKKTAEKQLNETREQMKILRLKLYEEQRQKLTQIIVANKKEMMEFRKSMEMESYKQEIEFKREVGEKDREIKLLTKNIEELINSNLTASSDLTVLEKIVRPIRESTQMKDEIAVLRKEVFGMKNELRDKHSKILGLESQNADITLSRDNMKSRNERLQIQKNLLIEQLQQKTEELQTAIKDRKALDLYYSEKWHSEFYKVKQNLEEKYAAKLKALEKEFEQKKRETEAQIEAHLERLRITKNELNQANAKVQQLTQLNQLQGNKIQKLNFQIRELSSVLREAQMLHREDLLAHGIKWQVVEDQLRQQVRKWQFSSNKFETQLHQTITQFNTQRSNLLQDSWKQIENLKKEHKNFILQLQQKHAKQLINLENHYSNSKQAIEAGLQAEMVKFDKKKQEINLMHIEQLKQADKIASAKVLKAIEKFNLSEIKYQKLKKQREDEIHEYNLKLGEVQKLMEERELQLIARDVEIEQFKKMKDTYIAEISGLNLRLNEESFQRRSIKVEFESLKSQFAQKERIIKSFESAKRMFKEEIARLQAEYKEGFSELERLHKKALFHSRLKITEMQRLFEKRPIKKQHYVHIQELEKKNLELKTEIHLKQAENLIIAEVKEYYETKAQQNYLSKPLANTFINPQEDSSKAFLSTNILLRNTNSNMRETVKAGQKPVFVKKYSNRRNKLIASSIKLDYFEEGERESETKEVGQMKRYLSRQQRITETSASSKMKTQPDRSKSCMN